jgi:hypothetical protein
MVAVVLSHKIDLIKTNVMPIWWHTSHLRKQLPRESTMWCNFDILILVRNLHPRSILVYAHHMLVQRKVEGLRRKRGSSHC